METTMSRVTFLCVLAGLLGACAAPQPTETALTKQRLACAAIGLDPGSTLFDSCVFDLGQSLRDEARPEG